MKFTHKLTTGFGLVAALALAMAGLFFFAFRQNERNNHLLFLPNHLRSREQAARTSVLMAESLRIAVTNTGVGITEADRRQLFVKYFRAERTQG